MIAEKVMQQLRDIAKKEKCDVIELVAELDGAPVFRLGKSSIPKGAKVGYPRLYSTNNLSIYRLDLRLTRKVITLDSWLNKRLQ